MIFSIKWFQALSIAVLSLGVAAVAPCALARSIIIPAPPQVAATAYILVDAQTGHILAEKNADEPLPPASLTKIMTSYVVAEELARGELTEQDQVYINDDAWRRGGASSGGSTMFLKPRTDVSVIDLLRGVIIQSGNDASIALAQHIAGSESAFADVMNQTAALLGMQNTHFENATGLPGPEHMTTARDLAILSQATIYDHPDHYPLYAEKSFTYNGIKQDNRNSLLFRDSTVDGLKTGHTNEAGYCLVATAQKGETRLISVVMGTRSKEARAVESQKLLSHGFRYYTTHSALRANTPMAEERVWQGVEQSVSLGVLDDVVLTIPKGSETSLEIAASVNSTLKAPINVGDALGYFTVNYQGKELYKGDLVALQAVEAAGLFSRLWDALVLFVKGLFA